MLKFKINNAAPNEKLPKIILATNWGKLTCKEKNCIDARYAKKREKHSKQSLQRRSRVIIATILSRKKSKIIVINLIQTLEFLRTSLLRIMVDFLLIFRHSGKFPKLGCILWQFQSLAFMEKYRRANRFFKSQ